MDIDAMFGKKKIPKWLERVKRSNASNEAVTESITEPPKINRQSKRSAHKRTEERERTAFKEKKAKLRWKDEDERDKFTVFVGNVARSVTKKNLFSSCGEIKSIRLRGLIPEKPTIHKRLALVTDRTSDVVKSVIYYIKFASDIAVTRALELNGHLFEDRHLRVDRTSSDKKRSQKIIDKSVFVGNVPFDADEEDLHSLFEKKYKEEVENVRVIRDQITGEGKGFAYVAFKTNAGPDLAILNPKLKFKGRQLRISPIMNKKKETRSSKKRRPRHKDTRQVFGKPSYKK
ncbi:hypothetical protein ACOME3_002247 [Neoechinorhynchus agilis]